MAFRVATRNLVVLTVSVGVPKALVATLSPTATGEEISEDIDLGNGVRGRVVRRGEEARQQVFLRDRDGREVVFTVFPTRDGPRVRKGFAIIDGKPVRPGGDDLRASGASALLVWTLKELVRAHQRFSDFVSEIAKVTRLLVGSRP